ncbi:hypothetical protein IWQ56_003931, partial [Coemansia nantahalensis]
TPDPLRRERSQKAFANLTSQVYDTISDSDIDESEAELRETFWARAMRPARSGMSTPYSPGRRKSLAELSSLISPQDLDEWMRWQDDGSSALTRSLAADEPGPMFMPTAGALGEPRLDPFTPPASKERTPKQPAGDGGRDGLLLSGSDDGSCRLWDVRTSRAVSGIAGYASGINAVGFVGAHSLIVACGADIGVYDQRALGLVSRAAGAAAVVKNVYGESEIQAASTRGDFVAYVDEDGRLGVCDVTDPADSTRFTGAHDGLAACVAFHPESATVATGGFDRRVLVWDVACETSSTLMCASPEYDPGTTRLVNPPFVYALDYAPNDEGTVISGHADGRLMCSSDAGTTSWMGCHDYSVSALQFVRSRPEVLATAGLDCTVRLWDADTLACPEASQLSPTSSPGSAQLLCQRLAAKPDTLASSDTSPVVYIDQGSELVAYALA